MAGEWKREPDRVPQHHATPPRDTFSFSCSSSPSLQSLSPYFLVIFFPISPSPLPSTLSSFAPLFLFVLLIFFVSSFFSHLFCNLFFPLFLLPSFSSSLFSLSLPSVPSFVVLLHCYCCAWRQHHRTTSRVLPPPPFSLFLFERYLGTICIFSHFCILLVCSIPFDMRMPFVLDVQYPYPFV